MSSGAITLQCPNCGGVFLTLQQGGVIEICPHCAVGAPRLSFTTGSGPPGVRPRADLPKARPEVPVATAAAPNPPPAPIVDTPLPLPIPAAQSTAPNRESVQAAPTVHEIVPRVPPPPENAPAKKVPIASPFGNPPDPRSPEEEAAELTPPLPETVSSAAPTWPELDREETPHPFGNATVAQAASPELEHREPAKRRAPWIPLAMLALLIASVTWLAFQSPGPVVVPSPPRSEESKPSIPSEPKPARTEAATPAPSPSAPPEPAPEIKSAIPNASPDQIKAIRARAAEEHLAALADQLIKGLEQAKNPAERRAWVDANPQQAEAMDRFFEKHQGRLNPIHLEASAGKVIVLPSGDTMKLFRLTTAGCREGAIVQVREEAGRGRLRWNLFEQSHEKTFDRFLASGDPSTPPQWFTLLCQRAHSFDLKGPTKDQWICLDAQGSLGAGGTGQIYLNKDSPVGRSLEPKLQWGRLYLAEVLIGRLEVDGRRINVVLDLASSGATAPAAGSR